MKKLGDALDEEVDDLQEKVEKSNERQENEETMSGD